MDHRITFDTDIRFRLDGLNFLNPDRGTLLLPKDTVVMEIKAQGGIPCSMPLWMARTLCEHNIFPATFSKYGMCYTGFIVKEPEIKMEEKISA